MKDSMKLKICISVFLGALLALNAYSQNVALKTNLLGWATLSPNAGVEWAFGQKSTLNVSGVFNPFRFGNYKHWKHWMVQPEYRYWFCEKFNGHFLGFHLLGGEYNIAKVKLPFGIYPNLADTRYQGWAAGAGVTYGYQWLLSKYWAIEATIGVGYVYTGYDRYPCASCGTRIESGERHYFGPTKAAVSMIYLF